MPLPGAISPAETGEIRARGEARRSEVDQSILQGLVRFGDVNVADKGRTTSRCSKAIIPGHEARRIHIRGELLPRKLRGEPALPYHLELALLNLSCEVHQATLYPGQQAETLVVSAPREFDPSCLPLLMRQAVIHEVVRTERLPDLSADRAHERLDRLRIRALVL